MTKPAWWSLVDGVLADNPGLEATTRTVLGLLLELDAELQKRGTPYPQTLAHLVALCSLRDESLRDREVHSGPHTVESLMAAFAGTGSADWSSLGAAAAGWLAEIT